MLDHATPLGELFEEQLAAADLVVVNKTDLVADDDWPQVEARVRQELRDGVGMVRARHAAVPMTMLVGLAAAAESDLDARPSHHDDGSEHEHDDFTSFHLSLPALDDPQAFVERLRRVIAGHPILRVKGFAVVAGKPMRLVLQGVGDRVQHYFDRAWRSDEPRAGRLVVIGERARSTEARSRRPCSAEPEPVMHLLNARSTTPDDAGEAVDLAQSPGDIVFLSAADTELPAWPRPRLAALRTHRACGSPTCSSSATQCRSISMSSR